MQNRQVCNRWLTPDRITGKDGSNAQEQFIARVHEKLGSRVLPREFKDIQIEIMPQYDQYDDETQNEQTFCQIVEELEPLQEVADHYEGVNILLPRGDWMLRGPVKAQSFGAIGMLWVEPMKL